MSRYEGHNIWLQTGNNWLASLVRETGDYGSGPVPQEDNRPKFIGFGLGGYRQTFPINVPAVVWTDYPGTNEEIGYNPKVRFLERHVRVTGAIGPPVLTDYWLKLLDGPPLPTHGTSTSLTYTTILGLSELSYGPYTNIPLSEIGLYLANSVDPTDDPRVNAPLAYHVFDTLQKTDQYEMMVTWTIRF